MFNDEIETTLSMWRDQNHINTMLKIYDSEIIPLAYRSNLQAAVEKAILDYLETYANEDI